MSAEGGVVRRQGQYDRAAPNQCRIELVALLMEAGPGGMDTASVMAVWRERHPEVVTETVKSFLYRGKRDGQIYGKGSYIDGRGQRFQYFAKQEWAQAFVFKADIALRDSKKQAKLDRERERFRKMVAIETVDEKEARLKKVRDRRRAQAWAEKGWVGELPPAKVYARDLTPEERKERERVRCLERWRKQSEVRKEERRARGEVVRRLPRSGGRKSRAVARPGADQVVVLAGTAAAVRVAAKPVLVGEPVITSETRVTVAKVQQDYRYWVDPETVRGEFSRLGVGRYAEVDEPQTQT